MGFIRSVLSGSILLVGFVFAGSCGKRRERRVRFFFLSLSLCVFVFCFWHKKKKQNFGGIWGYLGCGLSWIVGVGRIHSHECDAKVEKHCFWEDFRFIRSCKLTISFLFSHIKVLIFGESSFFFRCWKNGKTKGDHEIKHVHCFRLLGNVECCFLLDIRFSSLFF